MPVVWLLRYTNRTSNLKTALTRKYRIEKCLHNLEKNHNLLVQNVYGIK